MTTDYPPDIGGLQTYSRRVAEQLPGGLIARVIVGTDRPAREIPAPGPAFEVRRGRARGRAFLWSLARVLSLRLRGAIDFQLHMQWSTAFPSWLLKRAGFASRYVILIHGAELVDPRRPLLNRCKAAIFARADAVVAGSQATADLFRSLGFSARRLEVIHYGNPLEGETASADAARTPRAGAPRLLCMHRLVARKGTALLLDALAGLREIPWSLDIVGSGPEEEALRKRAGYLGLAGRIVFHAPASPVEKIRRLAEADLFVLPSLPPEGNNHVEGLGLTLLEAQSLGTPVLAARTGGIPEAILEGVTGALFAAGDAEDLRRKLADLLAAPERLPALGAGGPRWVEERFSWKKSLERLAGLIREIAAAPRAPTA